MVKDTQLMVDRGEFHFPGIEAAICADMDCGRCFSVAARSSDGVVRCPACGSTSYVLAEVAIAASATRANRLEMAVRWAIGEAVDGIAPAARVPPRAWRDRLVEISGIQVDGREVDRRGRPEGEA